MKKNEIELVVKHHFKNVSKLFKKIIKEYPVNDIIELRNEIKKLRSFLHLLDMESSPGKVIQLSQKLKIFYGYTGVIKNLKLHSQHISRECDINAFHLPVSYLDKINREIGSWETDTLDFIEEDYNFLDDEEKIMKLLPEKLTKDYLKKFIKAKFDQLKAYLTFPVEDESLSSIRKFLQDILYNWEYLRNYIEPIPGCFFLSQDREYYLEMLNEYRNKCIDIILLQTYRVGGWDKEEKDALNRIEKIWQEEKNNQIELVKNKLELIQLSPENVYNEHR